MQPFNQISHPLAPKTPFRMTRNHWIIIGILVIGLLSGGIIWYTHRKQPVAGTQTTTKKTSTETTAPPQPTTVASLIDGVMVSPEIANRRPVAAMIENSPDARPQAGLINADVVYEAVTEGGITRFMGIFSQSLPSKAGPIRSARSYFIDYMSEYDAIYAHRGGSPTALDRIQAYQIKDADNFPGYTRIPQAGVAVEHTLFANLQTIWEYAVDTKKWGSTINISPWLFKDPPSSGAQNGKLTLNLSSGAFQVIWNYDATTNSYLRTMAGVPHKDRTLGDQITAKTVVTLMVNHSPNPPYSDSHKESEWTMDTIGTGKASVFLDGKQYDGSWKKPSRTERTRFYDVNNNEIPLNRGKIWIEIVPQTGNYTWTTT